MAILALFLLIPPAQAHANTHKAENATKSDKPSPPNTPATPPQNDSGQKLQTEHQEHVQADVRVVSTPPKDFQDRFSFWVNLSLAIVGFLGVGVGIGTVLFIKAQVVEMRRQRVLTWKSLGTIRRQTKVMEDGLAMTRAKERARLTVTPIGFKLPGVIPYDFNDLIVEVANDGDTNAMNITAYGEVETIMSQPDPSLNSSHARRIPSTLKAGGSAKVEILFTDEHDLQNMPERHYGHFGIRVVGAIHYEDVFGDPHTTWFSYRNDPYRVGVQPISPGSDWHVWTIEGSDGWVKFGPPEANRAT